MNRLAISALIAVLGHGILLLTLSPRLDHQTAHRPVDRKITVRLGPQPAARIPHQAPKPAVMPPEPVVEKPQARVPAVIPAPPRPEEKVVPEPAQEEPVATEISESPPEPTRSPESVEIVEPVMVAPVEPVAEVSPSVEELIEEVISSAPVESARAPREDLPVAVRESTGEEMESERISPVYRQAVQPPYPSRARRRGYEGEVLLKVLVDRQGLVAAIEIDHSSGYRLLDQAALKAVRNWSFEPGRQRGEAIDMWIKVPIRFQLH